MSAWALGRESHPRFTVEETPRETLLTYAGRVLQWIPADVVVLFTAAAMALVDEPKDAAGKWLIIAGVIASALFVIGGAWTQRTPGQPWYTNKAKLRTALAPVAFLIWSPTVPDSGWSDLKMVADNPAWTVIICAIAGTLFALFVGGLEREA